MATAIEQQQALPTGPDPVPVEGKTVKALTLLHLKRTFDLFASNHQEPVSLDEDAQRLKLACKVHAEYAHVLHLEAPVGAKAAGASRGPGPSSSSEPGTSDSRVGAGGGAIPGPQPAGRKPESHSAVAKMLDAIPAAPPAAQAGNTSTALVAFNQHTASAAHQKEVMKVIENTGRGSAAVNRRLASKWPKPVWHAPWKIYRVLAGHLGWVRSVAVDPANAFFATGSADRTIKFWDTASGQLKVTLTGHIEQVTGLAVSDRHPYLFSCALDKTVKCWDLEVNKVIRNYHGHLSGVYSLALHPTLNILMTGGRDSVCRVWDIRTKLQVYCLTGHEQTVCSILAQPTDPQVITGSHDSTIKLWDLRSAKTTSTLTFHKKAVRTLVAHPDEHAFASAAADNIKKFVLPDGRFVHNFLDKQRAIVNAMAVNHEGVMATGGDNGSMWFWDWTSGHCYQQGMTRVQPGSLDAEAGIYAMAFDRSGSRLITCEADKTVKMWKEDEEATEQSYPGLPFQPPKQSRY